MNEKVMDWCEYELFSAIKYGANINDAFTRSYGVVQFVINEVHGWDSLEGKELSNWWNDEMWPKFKEAELY